MHKKESQKPPEHTSEHVKSKNFLGACPQTPLTQFILWAPLFAFALGPSNPLGGPADGTWSGLGPITFLQTEHEHEHFELIIRIDL